MPHRFGPSAAAFVDRERIFMTDIIFIGTIVVFFVLAALYASFCEKL